MEKVGKAEVRGWGAWRGGWGRGLNVQEGVVALGGCIGCIEGKALMAFVGCIGAKVLKLLAVALGVLGGAGFNAVKALRVWSGVMAREEGCVENAPLLDKAGVLRWLGFRVGVDHENTGAAVVVD